MAEPKPIKIDKPIVSVSIKKPEDPKKLSLKRPLPRPRELTGVTYKLKPPQYEGSLYVTITDHWVQGRLRPFELFVSAKDLSSFQWVSVFCRLVSALLRQPHEEFPSFLIEELCSTFDPRGGYTSPARNWDNGKGRFCRSVVDEIGKVLKQHNARLESDADDLAKRRTVMRYREDGSSERLSPPPLPGADASESGEMASDARRATYEFENGEGEVVEVRRAEQVDNGDSDGDSEDPPVNPLAKLECPICGEHTVVISEGCKTCHDCGWSNCG